MAQLENKEIVIVGGGFSGLALAYYLQNHFKITIIESKKVLGGVVRSESKNGFLLEYGPNTTRTTPELEELINQLDLSSEVVTPPITFSRKRYLGRSGTNGLIITATPNSLLEAITSPLLTATEKVRALAEIFVPKKHIPNETVESFVSRRFGKAVAEKIVAAVLSGIWAGDIKTMEAASSLSKLVEMELLHGSIIRGMLHRNRGAHKPRIISFTKGMSTLSSCLTTSLRNCEILTDTEIKAISLTSDKKVEIELTHGSFQTDQLILTQDSTSAAKMLAVLHPEVAEKLNRINYAPLGIVHLGFKRECVDHQLDGFGFLVPPIYGDGVLGCIFSSSMFPGRAPEGEVLLTIFVGGAAFPEKADVRRKENIETVIESVKNSLSIDGKPTFIEASFIPQAIPNYKVGHLELVNSVQEFCNENQAVAFLANWQNGISVADRISNAKSLAESLKTNRVT